MNKYSVTCDFNAIDPQKWNEFINNHPRGNYFQSPSAYTLFSVSDLFTPFIISVTDSTDRICGLLTGFSWTDKKGFLGKLIRRTVIYGGPLISDLNDQNEILELILSSKSVSNPAESVYIQIRNFSDTSIFRDTFRKFKYYYVPHENLLLRITDNEKVFKSISKSKQRQIRKSLASGAGISVAASIEEVRKLYELLSRHYRLKVAKPLPSWTFFENFYKLTLNDKSGIVLLVKYGDEIIGGCFCPLFNNKIIYEWYICGDDLRYKNLTIYPSVLATWAIIDYAIQNKLELVDFLGIGKPGEYYGVREFKTKFGGDIIEYGRYEKINKKLLYLTGKTGIIFWGKIRHLLRK